MIKTNAGDWRVGQFDAQSPDKLSVVLSVPIRLTKYQSVINRDSTPSHPNSRAAIPSGCLFALTSATITCVLLFINGAIVMTLLKTLSRSGVDWARDPRLMQFVLLLGPVILVVLQWMLLDYLRGKLRRSE
ncbi:MAG: hypothetical protein WBD20_04310 [Pirellulaceae bacterium]